MIVLLLILILFAILSPLGTTKFFRDSFRIGLALNVIFWTLWWIDPGFVYTSKLLGWIGK